MLKYTQADFDAIPRNEHGYKRLAYGDWSSVDFHAEDYLVFAAGCKLGDGCKLGNYCMLGNRCKLGDGCMLGNYCMLGNCCKLGDGCTMESGRVHDATYFFVSNIGSENRTTYAYCDRASGEIFIRAGCWLSGIDDFIQRVQEVHHGTQHETDYLAFAAFAKARFAQYQKRGG